MCGNPDRFLALPVLNIGLVDFVAKHLDEGKQRLFRLLRSVQEDDDVLVCDPCSGIFGILDDPGIPELPFKGRAALIGVRKPTPVLDVPLLHQRHEDGVYRPSLLVIAAGTNELDTRSFTWCKSCRVTSRTPNWSFVLSNTSGVTRKLVTMGTLVNFQPLSP